MNDHEKSVCDLIVIEHRERGSEAHPGNSCLQEHYDEYLDAVALARSGSNDDLVNMGRAYTKYAEARRAQEGSL